MNIDLKEYGLNEKSIKFLTERCIEKQNEDKLSSKYLSLHFEISGYLTALWDSGSLSTAQYAELVVELN